MAWDFSTEPEFQEHLDWMKEFVRAEIWPLETLDLDQQQIDRAFAPLRRIWIPSSAGRAMAR